MKGFALCLTQEYFEHRYYGLRVLTRDTKMNIDKAPISSVPHNLGPPNIKEYIEACNIMFDRIYARVELSPVRRWLV
jgi:hypothetical protein